MSIKPMPYMPLPPLKPTLMQYTKFLDWFIETGEIIKVGSPLFNADDQLRLDAAYKQKALLEKSIENQKAH